jgi:hypothetical protein
MTLVARHVCCGAGVPGVQVLRQGPLCAALDLDTLTSHTTLLTTHNPLLHCDLPAWASPVCECCNKGSLREALGLFACTHNSTL